MIKEDLSDVDDFVYENDKDTFTATDKYIEITCDDANKKINLNIAKNFVDKVNSSIKTTDLDSKSIVKAPSNNLFYCEALSKPNSNKYWGVDEIAHLPENNNDNILKQFISGDYNNNLTLGADKKLKASTPKYRQILTNHDGTFSNNTWTFNHSLLKNTKYYFVFDISKLVSDVRPFQVEIATIPFKLPALVQTFQVIAIDGSVKGWIEISIDANDDIIIIKSNVLSGQDEISIYEWETRLFFSTNERGW